MSDLAVAQGQARAARQGPRFSVVTGAVVGFLGGALLSTIVTVLLLWVEATNLWALAVACLAYAMAFPVWAGFWGRPGPMAATVGACLGGAVCGLLLGFVGTWMAFPDLRPNLVLAPFLA